jgi:lipopolysaccharide export system protein LptC
MSQRRGELREDLLRSERSLRMAVALAVVAAITQWLVWLRREPPPEPNFAGPPRSDYTLSDFRMSAMDAQGRLAFTVTAPRLARHPQLETFVIDTPVFDLRDRPADVEGKAASDDQADRWLVHATSAWVRADGRELRLEGAVDAQRQAREGVLPARIQSDYLVALLDERRLLSDRAVTLSQPGSILRGVGMLADLEQHQFTLQHEVNGRYDPSAQPTP